LVGGGQAWLASRWSPASVDLVGATLLLVKRPLEEFCRLRRLGSLMMKSPAGSWRSQPFGRSRPLRPNVAVIPGMSADRWLCPCVVGMTSGVCQGQRYLPTSIPGISTALSQEDRLRPKGRLRQQPAGDSTKESQSRAKMTRLLQRPFRQKWPGPDKIDRGEGRA
jgi:hypothetical protein